MSTNLSSLNPCVFLGGPSYVDNNLFDSSNPMNRDNCLLPFRLLKKELSKLGFNLTTEDVAVGEPLFELHMNAHESSSSRPKILLQMEPDWHFPAHADGSTLLSQYDLVFTWNDDLLPRSNYEKFYWPNPIISSEPDGFGERDIFISMISGNNPIDYNHEAELYSERYKTICSLEARWINDFHLYGRGWDLPANRNSLVFRILRKTATIWQPFYIPFPSYKGATRRKFDVYKRSRFAICYENAKGYKGYITEKLFDVITAGCIPVYLGAENVENYLPDGCYVDRRSFKTIDEVMVHLKNIDEEQFINMQKNIEDFLNSDNGQRFSADFFAKSISEKIVQYLKYPENTRN